MSNLSYEVVNAFTTSPTGGNPAAVVLFDDAQDVRATDSAWKQRIATDFNLSETAYPVPVSSSASSDASSARYSLKWFTPSTEVELCGHATLASAHVIFGRRPDLKELRFDTLSGELIVKRANDNGSAYSMDFPAAPFSTDEEDLKRKTEEALDVISRAVSSPANVRELVVLNDKGHIGVSNQRCIIQFKSDVKLEQFKVDPEILHELKWAPMIMFTQARNEPDCDIASRVFCPNCGIPEDPVTGSAHCLLAPFWLGTGARDHLTSSRIAAGERKLLAQQVSERIGKLDLTWDRQNARVTIVGNAVTTKSGTL